MDSMLIKEPHVRENGERNRLELYSTNIRFLSLKCVAIKVVLPKERNASKALHVYSRHAIFIGPLIAYGLRHIVSFFLIVIEVIGGQKQKIHQMIKTIKTGTIEQPNDNPSICAILRPY